MKSSNFKVWVKDVTLRAIKTASQAAVSVMTVNTIGFTHLDLANIGNIALGSAFFCVLQNLSNLRVNDEVLNGK